MLTRFTANAAREIVTAAVLAFTLFFVGSASVPVVPRDEARFAEAAREMLGIKVPEQRKVRELIERLPVEADSLMLLSEATNFDFGAKPITATGFFGFKPFDQLGLILLGHFKFR